MFAAGVQLFVVLPQDSFGASGPLCFIMPRERTISTNSSIDNRIRKILMEPLMAAENRRQTLLREMGIQCWFPRSALPGAGLSHGDDIVAMELEMQGQPQPQPAAAPQPGAAPKTSLSAANGPAVMSGSHHTREHEEVVRVADKGLVADGQAAGGPAVDWETPEFAFSWFNVDKRLSVLAMLPPDADRLNSACANMLKRILAALSPDWQELRLQEHTFHWPFPGDLGLPTGRLAARHAVDGFVARRLREQASATLLILADDTPPFLYSDNLDSDNLSSAEEPPDEDHNGALFVHRHFGFAMLRTQSLHAMDANSELKRSAWQAMKPLRERLHRGAG
jgi:hypothetical protein